MLGQESSVSFSIRLGKFGFLRIETKWTELF
uniref:Uncharacterized protein n=1 Tax=Rhizophora mucronata TaxID=61149 RepID=A0A2P2QLC4_RHIMU